MIGSSTGNGTSTKISPKKNIDPASRLSNKGPSYDDEDCYVVTGTQGSLSVPTMRFKGYTPGSEASWWLPFTCETLPLQRVDPILRQMAHFAQVVRGEAAPKVSAADGLANLRVTEAVVQAAQSGTLVSLT